MKKLEVFKKEKKYYVHSAVDDEKNELSLMRVYNRELHDYRVFHQINTEII